jgi:hypothetical protein
MKLAPHKAHICPAREFAAELHLLELQRLLNKIVRTTANFPRGGASVRGFHEALHIPYVYD